MIIRKAPTEKERRRMKRLNLLDYFCMGVAALILILTVLAMIYGRGGIQVLELVMILGAVMNMCLAVRAALLDLRLAAAGAFLLAILCGGGVLYLVLA